MKEGSSGRLETICLGTRLENLTLDLILTFLAHLLLGALLGLDLNMLVDWEQDLELGGAENKGNLLKGEIRVYKFFLGHRYEAERLFFESVSNGMQVLGLTGYQFEEGCPIADDLLHLLVFLLVLLNVLLQLVNLLFQLVYL